MNLTDFPDEIYLDEIFPNLSLYDLHNTQSCSYRMNQLVKNYIYELFRKLNLRQHTVNLFNLVQILNVELSSTPNEFSNLVHSAVQKIISLTRFYNLDDDFIPNLNKQLRNCYYLFEKEWIPLFEKFKTQTILRPSTFLILRRNIPAMGLTFQNTETRILDRLFPKWNEEIKNILQSNHLSDSDIDEIRTELNTKIYLMLS